MVLAVARRGNRGQAVNHIYAAFEGSPEALRVTQSVCSFPLTQVEREDLLLASARTNVSCAMRFSHTAISVQAQRVLTAEIRRFLPAHPNEAIMPLGVSLLPQQDRNWVDERLAAFTSYGRHVRVARLRMGKLFAVASASLASQAFLTDDKCTHEMMAFIPNLDGLPLRLQIELPAMAPDNGWNRLRNVDVWVVHSTTMTRATITFVQYDFDSRTLAVELSADTRSQQSIRDAVIEHGRVFDDHTARVRVCVRLSRPPSGTDPVFELLAASNLFFGIDPTSPFLANFILDSVYGGRPRDHNPPPPPPPTNMTIILDSRRLQLRPDQARAVEMSTGAHPIFAIQAAYGTGKTVIGAFIAARLSVPGELVIATATTNVAIAQFTETLLRLDEFSHLPILRFVADSALQEGAPRTPVDLHTILQSLLSRYSDGLHPQDIRRLRRYTRGRRLLEQLLFHPEQLSRLSEEEREEYRIAEMCNSEATERAIAILLRLQFPAVLCITTSSLLNSTREGGLFHELLSSCRTIIADEASQIPEPVFVAMVTRFPQARHIYIGDVHQLQPHLRCPRSALAARLGGRGVMSLLLSRNIPLAPLVTTFRAHPALVHLSNTLVCDGTLESGTPAHRRNDLIPRLSLQTHECPSYL
nr:Hypothetical protein CBG22588 [Haemonchus contortus]